MKKYLFLSLAVLLSAFTVSAQWVPDQGDGTYRNPVIYADYSDADVIRVGDDYWMVASSFSHFPGIPVLHSRDLVNWEIVGHVYDRLPLGKYDRPQHGEGSWAPAIRYHDGMYYVYFCTPYDGLYVARATDPRGPWDMTQMLEVAKWEDPCPFWDDNGDAYLLHSIHRGGPAILHRMSPDGLRLLDNGTVVYHDGKANPVLEGMKMHKRDGWYYILAPAGGVSTGWQTVLRSRSPYGPYEARKVLAQGPTDINGPHQGGLVDTPDGSEWWFMHFQSNGAFGRVIHLQPAHWTDDGWLAMGVDPDGDGIGQPVRTYRKPHIVSADGKVYEGKPCVPQTSDDFSDTVPGRQWQWQAHPRKEWYSLTARPGYMRLYAEHCASEHGNIYFAGNLYLQKLSAPTFTATTYVETAFETSGERAGLTIFGNEYSYIAVIRGDDGAYRISVVTGKNDKYAVKPKEKASVNIPDGNAWLRVSLDSPTECSYYYSLDGKEFTRLGPTCQVVAGTWVGAKVGIFCSSPNVVPSTGYADFDYFTLATDQ